MQPDTFAILGFMALFGGGLGALFWKRLDRIEVELSTCVKREAFERSRAETKAEIAELRSEMKAEIAKVRSEIAELRSEMKDEIAELRSEMRSEIAALRSDLTQIALALGTHRPRATEA